MNNSLKVIESNIYDSVACVMITPLLTLGLLKVLTSPNVTNAGVKYCGFLDVGTLNNFITGEIIEV